MTQVRKYEPSSQRLRMLIYGSPGVGKTVFCNTAPKPLFLAAEEGLLSLADAGVNYVQINTTKDLWNVYYALEKNELKGADGKPIECETIVIDSLTELQQVIIRNITGGRMPSQNQWGDFSTQMAEVLYKFKKLDKHLILVALENEKMTEDDLGKEYSRYTPELYGKLMQKTAAMVDMVGRYYMRTEVINDRPTAKRVLTFQYHPSYIAKDRSGKLPPFADPDFSNLLAACKIVVKTEEVVSEVPDAPEAQDKSKHSENHGDLPAAEGKKEMITPDQTKLLFTLWHNVCDVLHIPKEEQDNKRRATTKEMYGVYTSKQLTKTQASHFIDKLKSRLSKELDDFAGKPKEEPKKEAPKEAIKIAEEEIEKLMESMSAHGDAEGLVELWNDLQEEPFTNEQYEKLEDHFNKCKSELSGEPTGSRAKEERQAELEDMTKSDLQTLASNHSLRFTTKSTAAQLIEKILKKEFPAS